MVETDSATGDVGKRGPEPEPGLGEPKESSLQKHYASGGHEEDVDKTTTVKES